MKTRQMAQNIRLSMRSSLLSLMLLVVFSQGANGQKSMRDSSIALVMFSPQFKVQLPGAELADRYGWSSSIGAQFTYKTKSNFLIGAEASFIFGTVVKEDSMLNYLLNSNGNIVDVNGFVGDVVLDQRAFDLQLSFSKYILEVGPNPNCGFYAGLGIGYLQHKIRIRDLADKVPLLQGDYVKGYDRLTGGLAISERLGYRYFANNRRVNFYIELEAMQGLTRGLRSYQFDLRAPYTSRHFDALYSLKIGWTFTMYKRAGDNFYFD